MQRDAEVNPEAPVHESAPLTENPSPTPAAPSLWARVRGPWQEPSFRWYWAGALAQAMSHGMQFLVLGWLVLEVTGDQTQLGLTISLYGLPNIAFLMAGGVIADRLDRKQLLMVTQTVVGAMIGVLAALTITGQVALWHIYLAAALLGVLQGLNMPARLAMLSDLVGERKLLDAVGQFNAAQHAGRIVGPPIAGVLIDQLGMGVVLVLNAGVLRRQRPALDHGSGDIQPAGGPTGSRCYATSERAYPSYATPRCSLPSW